MKKYLFLIALLSFITLKESYSQVQVTSEGFFQVDYTTGGTSLTVGENAGAGYPYRGQWAIEYYGGGLNFWRPWPNSYYGSYKLFIKDNGYIGINDGTPSYQLDVNGDIATYGTLRISSDERFKSDIKLIQSSLDNLKKLEGVSYKMKKYKKNIFTGNLEEVKDEAKLQAIKEEMAKSEASIPETEHFGFIAQKLKEIYPELVDEDADGYLNVDYIGLIPVLVEAIKEQQSQIDELKKLISKQ